MFSVGGHQVNRASGLYKHENEMNATITRNIKTDSVAMMGM